MSGILSTKDYIHFKIIQDNLEFSGAEKAGRCLAGDIVTWNFDKNQCECIDASEHGEIVGVLELTSKTRYGLTSRGTPIYLFRPFDPSYPPFVVGSTQRDLQKNMLCSIVYKRDWPIQNKFPRGEIYTYFGTVGDWKAERRAILSRWCKETSIKLNKKEWEGRQPSENMLKNRQELSWGLTFHIDPDGCCDVDDILTLSDISATDGTFTLGITISDVAAWVHPNSDIALSASQIGQTFYDESGKIVRGMLPSILSEQICSLRNISNTSTWKLGISLILKISKEDKIVGEPQLILTKIRSTTIKTYTYDNFTKDLEKDIGAKLKYQTNRVYLALESALGRAGENPNNTHSLVETTMLYYNWWVGNFLACSDKKAALQTLYRIQDVTNVKRASLWQAAIENQKCGLNKGWLAASVAQYSFKNGNNEHANLKLKNYCHASSPIRRFADLWIQWILHKELECYQRSQDLDSDDSELNNNVGENGIPRMDCFDDIVPKLNGRMAACKKYGREIAIIASLEKGIREFEGICLEWKQPNKESQKWRGYFWIDAWKEVAVVRQLDSKHRPFPGEKCKIRCGINWSCGIWKERFVLELIDI